MEKFLKISAVNLKYHLLPHLMVSLLLCLAAPLFIGTKNLDTYQVAKVMEAYVALAGIILFIPVFIPDMNRDIRDLVASKRMPVYFLHMIRILWALVFLVLLSILFLVVLKEENCAFDFGEMFYTVMANALFLGGMGMIIFALFDQAVFAYMIPLVYYVINFGGRRHLGKFYLFSMQAGHITEKHYLFACGVIFMAGAVLVRKIATSLSFSLYYLKGGNSA